MVIEDDDASIKSHGCGPSIANTNLYLLLLLIFRQQHANDTCIYVRYEKSFL